MEEFLLPRYTLPKKDPINVSVTWQTPWVLLTLAFFHRKSVNFVISRNTDIDWYNFDTEFLSLLTFPETLKIFWINLVLILMMSAKMATPGLLKLTIFWNNVYDVITRVDDISNKISSSDSNYVVDLFMWPKFGNSSISMREVITTSTL